MNWRIIGFELKRAKANPVLILGYALLALYVMISLVYLKRSAPTIRDWAAKFREAAEGGQGQQVNNIFSALGTDPAVQNLVLEAPPVSALFFIITMIMIPWLAMLIASDQLATEIRHKQMRFLLPRASRHEIFWSRLFAGWLLWLPIVIIGVLPAWIALGLLEPSGSFAEDTMLALRMAFAFTVYGASLVGLVGFFNTFIPISFLSYLAAIGAMIIVGTLANVGSWGSSALGYIEYLSPTSMKDLLMASNPIRLLGGVLGTAAYTAVFGLAGAWLFNWRDL